MIMETVYISGLILTLLVGILILRYSPDGMYKDFFMAHNIFLVILISIFWPIAAPLIIVYKVIDFLIYFGK